MNRIVLDADLGAHRVSRHIYGHFAEHLGRCIYDGIWVGPDATIPNTRGLRDDVVAALRRLRVPNLRWPGGCFADEYHWEDGIGPPRQRPTMVNTHWGGVAESNHFGTHEFMDLCAQLGCEPYICGNLGSGTVREMQQWVEYLTAAAGPMAQRRRANGRAEPWRVRLWGVGNENWGCGGRMRPEYYADEYRRYATYVRAFGDNRIARIACGPNGGDVHWTEVLMREAAGAMDGLALHYYCGSGLARKPATQIDGGDWFAQLARALRMDELVALHTAVMDRWDPSGRVGLYVDEWGAWHAVEPGTNPHFLYQQNTIRDALVAAVTLDIFNRHGRRVAGANIAQTINVLQAMVLTEGERLLLTPTFHVFEMYAPHQDAALVPLHLACDPYAWEGQQIPGLSASATRADDGSLYLTVSNLHPERQAPVAVQVRGVEVSSLSARVLAGAELAAHNTFDAPARVAPAPFDGVRRTRAGLELALPPRSVVAVALS